MPTTTLTIPQNYGYVLLLGTATSMGLSACHFMLTSVHRKRARVPYPNAYATAVEASTSEEKFRFNCAQKSHQQYLEHQTTFLVSLFVAGLKFPEYAMGLGGLWALARVMYAFGYSGAKDVERGKGRLVGSWWSFPHLGLVGLAVWASLKIAA